MAAGGGKAGGEVHVALLRGVNVGGKNRLPMKDLAEMFRAEGCTDVRTYIQSGNVVFRAALALAGKVPALVSAAIGARFGFSPVLVTRSAADLEEAAGNNPFLARGEDPDCLHVGFLLDKPSAEGLTKLDPARNPPEEFAVRGREVYLFCPKGVADSKLTAQYFDSRLKTTLTARNWRTVLQLVDMARAV